MSDVHVVVADGNQTLHFGWYTYPVKCRIWMDKGKNAMSSKPGRVQISAKASPLP